MVSVSKRTDDRPKPWMARWRDGDGKQHRKSFRRKVDADRFAVEVEHAMNAGTYIDPDAGKVTFRQFAEEWRVAQPHRTNTALRTKSQLTRHVYPVLGSRPLASIRTSTVQSLVTGLSPTLAPGSVRTVYATVRAVFGAAVRDRLIPLDPCVRIKLPDRPRVQVVPLTVDLVDALAAAIEPRYRGLVETGAGTGLRQGELFAVEESDIDFDSATLTVERQVQVGADNTLELCPLKNKDSYRTVPLGSIVVERLRAHLKQFPPVEVELLDRTGPRPIRRKARLVFTTPAGLAVGRNRFNDGPWAAARKAAGLPEATCHDLRHFFASALIRKGLSPKVVAARLGHADASITLRVYTHLWPDDEDRSRQAIDDMLRRADVPHMRPKPEG